MAEESIESLKAQIASLSRDNSRLVAENTRRKTTNRDLQSKLTAATTDLTQTIKDRDQLKSKVDKTPASDNEEVEGLRTQVRSYRHRDGLAELAYGKDIGLSKSVPIDRLMRLIDYKPVAEDFDAAAVKKTLLALKETDSYLFGESAAGNGRQGTPVSQAITGLGSAFGRGSSPGPVEEQVLSEEQLRSPVFMSEYHAKMRAANK